jgi:hypothetical protein
MQPADCLIEVRIFGQTCKAESAAASCQAIEDDIDTGDAEAMALYPLADVILTGRVRNVSEKQS